MSVAPIACSAFMTTFRIARWSRIGSAFTRGEGWRDRASRRCTRPSAPTRGGVRVTTPLRLMRRAQTSRARKRSRFVTTRAARSASRWTRRCRARDPASLREARISWRWPMTPWAVVQFVRHAHDEPAEREHLLRTRDGPPDRALPAAIAARRRAAARSRGSSRGRVRSARRAQ